MLISIFFDNVQVLTAVTELTSGYFISRVPQVCKVCGVSKRLVRFKNVTIIYGPTCT